jgi:hypothetical protein
MLALINVTRGVLQPERSYVNSVRAGIMRAGRKTPCLDPCFRDKDEKAQADLESTHSESLG